MKKTIFLLFLLITTSLSVRSQLIITPTGELVDSLSSKTYEVIEASGSKSELYNHVKKNVFKLANKPGDVADYIDNEMISLTIIPEPVYVKFAFQNIPMWVKLSLKLEFKDNKIKVSGNWLTTYWMSLNNRAVDPVTLLTYGSVKCFKKKGSEMIISSPERFIQYNSIAQNLIRSLLNFNNNEEDW